MGAAGPKAGGSGGRRRGRRGGRGGGVISEINITPMVDVMLVLLIIFMVAAPMLTVGVPIDLPQSQAGALNDEKEPLTISVNTKGEIFLQETPVQVNEIVPRLNAITKQGYEERIYVRGDKAVNYGQVMQVMGTLSAAGFRRVALVTEVEQGG
ncbi:protein TolR [Terrihabitans rhizophilus]|jgi:biopolymer transport protein TolR|uniref:Protein TolR n=1 Tax=Terrihabitans rhizophilus TaxID=3092662 RepID=A0ABU4RSW0_9HYPH|nr:protein TolR [Terrihabitans sp. PJ23]MDX6806730.1 protein TolR [Terrihabitans sp. PJ23]